MPVARRNILASVLLKFTQTIKKVICVTLRKSNYKYASHEKFNKYLYTSIYISTFLINIYISRFFNQWNLLILIVYNCLIKILGCLDDIRLEGKHLPLPPAMNGTQWGQATMARNLERNCPSNKPCANVICQDPFECIDLWNEYDCT